MGGDTRKAYTTQLQAGLGLIEETKLLLAIHETGMSVTQLHEEALDSGLFPAVSARRLRNIIAECFSPRYLKTNAAAYLKKMASDTPSVVFIQFLLVFTAQANKILFDFIITVYWARYLSGRDTLTTDDAKDFITTAVKEGKTGKPWSDTTVRRMSSYLIGCCADYGLLSSNRKSIRQIQTIRIHECTLLFFAYWLHFSGLGDNSIVSHEIWKLFGLEPSDVREELKRISKKNWLIVQTAGDVTRISWRFSSMEEVVDVILESKF